MTSSDQMASRQYFFVSGLPRSGSTLLSAILRQNPKATAGMTSPVGSITGMVRVAMSQNPEISSLINDTDRKKILKGVFDGFYDDSDPDGYVFDTNRGWTGRIPELMALFDDQVKIIAMVRDPAWIMDSVERIIQRAPLRQSKMVNPGSTLVARAEGIMANDGMVGSPLGHLKSALSGQYKDRILLVEYDALCEDPAATMKGIYDFLGVPHFEHDFVNLEFQEESFDEALMTPDLHTVKGPVRKIERTTLLPLEIFERLSNCAFWRRG